MIDLALIEKGEHYSKLNRSYVIFICSFDLFGKNRCVYTFENRCIEDSEISLGDETVKVFLNSRGDSTHLNSNLKAFLEYMNHKKESENDFITMLDREVKKAKANLEWRREYMTLYIKFQEMMEEGREEGDMRRLISQVRKKSEKGISSEAAADMLEESPEMIERIMDLIQNYPTMDDKQIYDELNR